MCSREPKADPSAVVPDVNGVMHVRRVPSLKIRPALGRRKQARGALDVAVRGAP